MYYIQFGLNLRTRQKGLHLVFWNFLQLWHSWGCIDSGDITVLRFIFDISVPQHHLAIFFILFHLKPAINSTNLASISLYYVCCFAKTTHELHCCIKCPQILREKTSSQNSQGIAFRIQWHFFH